jgi:hypothetical protein
VVLAEHALEPQCRSLVQQSAPGEAADEESLPQTLLSSILLHLSGRGEGRIILTS